MKRTALLPILLLLACGKHHDSPVTTGPKPPADLGKPYALPTASQANPTDDASSEGMYKGVAINSDGEPSKTYAFHIANTTAAVYAYDLL